MVLVIKTCLQVQIKNERGDGSMAPCVLKLEFGFTYVVRFTSEPLKPLENKCVGNPLNRKPSGPQSRSETLKLESIHAPLFVIHLITYSLSLMKCQISSNQKQRSN
jgi:hypothetical protein